MSKDTGFFQEDEILGQAYDRTLTRRLVGYLRPYRGKTILSFFLLLPLSASQIAPLIIAKSIIYHALPPHVTAETPLTRTTGRPATTLPPTPSPTRCWRRSSRRSARLSTPPISGL